LRDKREALATLVSAENGKILSEADGEVQEMLDIADFAIGQARMLYGRTMPSERPAHRMYEQWHPLGPIAVITAFNLSALWIHRVMKVLRLAIEEESPGLKPGEIQLFA
jgi:aldehyde dehydrogenase (NAD+)